MGRLFTATFKSTAVTAVQDLFEVLAASDALVKVHGFTLTQVSEAGDAEEEQLLLTTNRGESSTSGTGGSTVTAARVDGGDAAFSGTIEANNTTQMSGGTLTELEVYAWNLRVPYQMWYTPETRPKITPGDRWTLELETAPSDSVTMSCTLWLEEGGG